MIVYSKGGTQLYATDQYKYTGSFMSDRSVSLNAESPVMINFLPDDYVNFRGERFVLDYTPTAKKIASAGSIGNAFSYELVFVPFSHELRKCDFLDVVLGDNNLHYTGLSKVEFTGNVQMLAGRIQANLNRLYTGGQAWMVNVDSNATDKIHNISLTDSKIWDALLQANTVYGLNFIVKGRIITIGVSGTLQTTTFEYGKGNPLYSLDRVLASNDPVITRLRCYGSTENLPLNYKKGTGSVIPVAQYITELMLPDYETTGIDYLDASAGNKAIYGIREGTFRDETVKPSIKNMTGEAIRAAGGDSISNGRVDQIISTELIEAGSTKADFKFEIPDIGFDINTVKGSGVKIEITSGRMGGVALDVVHVIMSETGYTITANRNTDSTFPLPDNVTFLSAGDTFVITGIYMPQIYVDVAELELAALGYAYLADNDHSKFAYGLGINEIYMVNSGLKNTLFEGDKLSLLDSDIGLNNAIIIQQLNITYGGLLPKYEITLSDKPILTALDLVRRGIDTAINISTAIMSESDRLTRITEIRNSEIINKITNIDLTETTLNTYLQGENDVSSGIIDGAILWKEGLTYTATDINYKILGDKYTSFGRDIPLSIADPTLPRIDTFYGDIFGNLNITTGIPATNPIGLVLSGTQLFFMEVRIEAGALVPTGLDVDWVYLENTPPDWATALVVDNYTTIDFASIDTPATGLKRIKLKTNVPQTEQSIPFHKIGDKYKDGIILWLSANGGSGLIAAPTDIQPCIWSRLTGAGVVGSGAAGIGDGKPNTVLMMSNNVARTGAAKYCTDYKFGIYGYGHMPSQAELYLMWINKDRIGGLKEEWYWSSSESGWKKAVAINFANGSADTWDKNNTMNLRPIMAFDDSVNPINIPVPAITLKTTEMTFTSPTPVAIKAGVLSFKLKTSLPWTESSSIIITSMLGAVNTGVVAMKRKYLMGYKPDNTDWQMVAIPMSKFKGGLKPTIDKFRFNFKFEWPNLVDIGFDDIRYQYTTIESIADKVREQRTDYRFEELPDGIRTVFTTLNAYIAGTVELFINGQKQIKGVGYFEENSKIRIVNVLDEYDTLMCNYYTYI